MDSNLEIGQYITVWNALIVVAVSAFAWIALRLATALNDAPAPDFAFVGGKTATKDNTYDPRYPVAHQSSLIRRSFLSVLIYFARRPYDLIEQNLRLHRSLGRLVVGRFAGKQSIVVADAELARKILVTSVDQYPKTDFSISPSIAARGFLGLENVVFSNGEQWKRARKALNPAFYNVDRFIKIFENTVDACFAEFDRLLAKRNEGSGTSVVVHDYTSAFTLDVLGKSVFNYDFDSLHGKTSKQVKAYSFIMKNFITPLQLLFPWVQRLPTQFNRDIKESLDILDEMFYNLINASKEKLQKRLQTQDGASPITSAEADSDKISIVDMMVESELSPSELRDNTAILFLAGHDTTGNALASALAVLATHQEVQRKLLEAVQRDIGSDFSNAEKLQSCQYLEFFIKEVLRLYPPVIRLPARTSSADNVFNGYRVPKDTIVAVSISSIHRDPTVWGEDCEEFVPERFSPERSKNRPSHAWMPFGGGRRVCLGQQFSLQEQRLFLAKFVQRYEAKPAPGFEQVRLNKRAQFGEIEQGYSIIIQPRSL